MPAKRPRASFEPLPPDFDVQALVEGTEKFDYVHRISCDIVDEQGIDEFEKLVLLHVIKMGQPLVVDGFDGRLDPWMFSPRWLRDNHGDKIENARNITNQENLPLTIGHYLRNMGVLTDQFFEAPENYRDRNRQRIYLKDIDCPSVWERRLKELLPSFLFYQNDSTGDIGGPGAVDEPAPDGTGTRTGRGIAAAGDLMSCLPHAMRADNLMCYIGHEGTYTPSHREMCASLGHNIMVEASGSLAEDGRSEKPGSSIWFIHEAKDRATVAEYWQSILGHDIEVEAHFAQMAALKRAPFNTYVVEQRPGDFILIPPLAPHQVWNRGTRTMKVAWNRTTVETLELAFAEALASARLVCRDEQYKNKAIVYYTLVKYAALLRRAYEQSQGSSEESLTLRYGRKVRQLEKDFKRLLLLFRDIMLSEMYSPNGASEKAEFIPFDSNVSCAYCRCNIFNRFLSCPSCADAFGGDSEEPYDVCMECYAMGRSCSCVSGLKWVEQWKWKDLLHSYEEWRKLLIMVTARESDSNPLPLLEERRQYAKKTLAQVCQEQLKLRPWKDYKNPRGEEVEDEAEEIQVNEDGRVKKISKKRSQQWLRTHHSCHVCSHRHPKWKMAKCSTCQRWWCYGAMFRAHEQMPFDIMSDPGWSCPHCQMTCSTGACRKDPRQTPYQPKRTRLGHDTKKVADSRSTEVLVDFGVSNLSWLNETADRAPDESQRLAASQQEAERAKQVEPTLDENYAEDRVGPEQDLSAESLPAEGHGYHRRELEQQQSSLPPRPRLPSLHSTGESLSHLLEPIQAALYDDPPTPTHPPHPLQQSTSQHARGEVMLAPSLRIGPIDPTLTVDSQRSVGAAGDGHETGWMQPDMNHLVGHRSPNGPYLNPDPGFSASLSDGGDVQPTHISPALISLVPTDPYVYPDPHEPERSRMARSPKRALAAASTTEEEIKLIASKRRKTDERGGGRRSGTGVSGATKEYRREQDRKTLEEARKAGWYTQAYAKIKGRSRVVVLKCDPSRLAQILQPRAANAGKFNKVSRTKEQTENGGLSNRNGDDNDDNGSDSDKGDNNKNGDNEEKETALKILLRSNVSPGTKKVTVLEPTTATVHTPKSSSRTQHARKTITEDDAGFSTHYSRRKGGSGGGGGASDIQSHIKSSRRVEMTPSTSSASSDSDNNDNGSYGGAGAGAGRRSRGADSDAEEADGAASTAKGSKGRSRRQSAWSAKMRRGEEGVDADLPAELPADWHDGQMKPRRQGKRQSYSTDRSASRQSNGTGRRSGTGPATAVATEAAKPTAAKPAAKPTAAKPTTAKLTTAKPTAAEPTVVKPTISKPAAKPTAKTTAKLTATKLTAAKPTAAKPAAKPTAARTALAGKSNGDAGTGNGISIRPNTVKDAGKSSTGRKGQVSKRILPLVALPLASKPGRPPNRKKL